MWDWINIGEATKGALLGGLLALLGSTVTQLLIGRQQSRQLDREIKERREAFIRESEENRAVMRLKHEREDNVADRAQREWASQQIWDRRADAYDRILALLSELEFGFQRVMDHSLNPVGHESEVERHVGREQAQRALDQLAESNLYVNERTIEALTKMRRHIADSNRELSRTYRNDSVGIDQMLGAQGVSAAKTAIKTVRIEAREHLGDKPRSIRNVVDDALKASTGQ